MNLIPKWNRKKKKKNEIRMLVSSLAIAFENSFYDHPLNQKRWCFFFLSFYGPVFCWVSHLIEHEIWFLMWQRQGFGDNDAVNKKKKKNHHKIRLSARQRGGIFAVNFNTITLSKMHYLTKRLMVMRSSFIVKNQRIKIEMPLGAEDDDGHRYEHTDNEPKSDTEKCSMTKKDINRERISERNK